MLSGLAATGNDQYNENVRMFALTVNYYSPRCYKYIRDKFDLHLPHKKTLQKWYANSNVSGNPGFYKQSIEILTENVRALIAQGTEPLCALIFDEMAIRKHLQWSRSEKKFLGHVNYGFRPDCSEVPLAKNALVFMMNGINFDATIPIAHFFINTLKAEEKVNLLKEIIAEITKCGVRVLSITFDGFSANFKMSRLLGAKFNINNLKPYFLLPGDERKIYVIVDPSHVLKLVRNTLGNNKVLCDDANEEIDWKYFENLEQLRVEKDFTHVHKLTKKHIQYTKNKMKVIYAAQTLSNSVSASMEFLQQKNHAQFKNSSATIRFVRFINDGFDIMNTKGIESLNQYKNAINSDNKLGIFKFLDELNDYVKQIKFKNGELVIKSNCRTAFRGLTVNSVNFRSIYEECVDSNILDCLPTFRFSQDHIESFFGRIRSLPGCSDNPTVEQFCAAFKKIVVVNEIRCSDESNCADNLKLSILDVSARKSRNTVVNPDDSNLLILNAEDPEDLEYTERLNEINNNYKTDNFVELSIAYIAGTIEEKIVKNGRFQCGDCQECFSDNENIPEIFACELDWTPCQSTFDICKTAHKYIQHLSEDYTYTFDKAKNDILREFNEETAYPKTNFEGHEDHKGFIIDFIVEYYINIRATYIAKTVTLKEQTMLMRNKLRKLTHFRNE